jgi:cytochrome c5
VNKFRILISCLCLILPSVAMTDDSAIAERIKKVGEVCIQGNDCGAAAASMQVAESSGGASAESNYNKSCATCHNVGVAGAPKMGDVAAWEPRIAQGMEVLYNHGINGMPPAMPAKGMCFSCSEDDIKALVDYMVSASQ